MKQAALYRISLAASVLGLVASGVSFAFPTVPTEFLCFYFASCWLLWIACVFASVAKRALLLVAMWLAIDLSILVMFFSVTASAGDVGSSPGTELVWFVCYAPMILPCGFALIGFKDEIEAISSSFQALFSPVTGRIVFDWLQFSFVAAVQALVISLVAPSVQGLHKWWRH